MEMQEAERNVTESCQRGIEDIRNEFGLIALSKERIDNYQTTIERAEDAINNTKMKVKVETLSKETLPTLNDLPYGRSASLHYRYAL